MYLQVPKDTIVFISGVPGSGKTTVAYELFKNYCDFRIVEETDIIREILRGYRKHLALMGISIPDEITPHNVFLDYATASRQCEYMKEKEKRQKENLLTQIVVTLLTITLSSVTNAIGDGTNEAIRRGVMVSSVCILILVSLVFGHYIKKHLEKADDEFQISKNLREALNYYANNLYKENPLTII